MMTLSGCVTASNSYRGSAEETRAAATPAGECRRLAKPVPAPGYRAGQDARHVIMRYDGALGLANRRIDDLGACADTAADRAAR